MITRVGENLEKLESLYISVGNGKWKTVWKLLNSVLVLKIELPCDLAISPLGIYPKDLKAEFQRHIYTPVFICKVFHNSQEVEAIWMFMDKWMHKENIVYTYNGILFISEGSPVTYYNTDEAWGHHAQWNEMLFVIPLYEVCNQEKLLETK